MKQERIRKLALGLILVSPLCALAYYLSFLLRFAGDHGEPAWSIFWVTLAWTVAAKLTAIHWFRVYDRASRYVTFQDLLDLTKAVSCSSISILIIDTFLIPRLTIPRSIILLDWGTTLCLLAAARSLPRIIRDGDWHSLSRKQGTRALIAGANDAGEELLRAVRRSPSLRYKPIGFVDDRSNLKSRRIGGLPVLGSSADIAAIIENHAIEEVLITAGELPGKQVRALADLAQEHGFRIKVLPSYEQLLHEHVAVQPRPLEISDLLQRPSVELNIGEIEQWLQGRVLLVTGSAGSIGSEICRQLVKLAPAKLLFLDRSETGQFFLERELRLLAPQTKIEVVLADLNDHERLYEVFRQHRPDIIFHAAAYKHVPLMETHVGEAVKNIVFSTRELVDLAEEFEAEGFVMISTDKAVNPTSVMGSCKRLAEQYVQAKAATSSCRFVTVRFGNVLDSAGSVVPVFSEQIARGGPITVTHPEMVRFFMLIPEAAQLVIQAGAMGQGGEIFVLDMGQPVRILDLARDMIRLSGLRVGEDIEIEITGLRPGEKLFEELYGAGENHLQTAHPKIMVASSASRNLLEILYDLGRLGEVVNQPHDVVRSVLQDVIPVQSPAVASSTLEEHRQAA